MTDSTRSLPATPGTHGFDASEKLTLKRALALRQAGFSFAIRYLSRKSPPPEQDLTLDEVDAILDAGLALMAVQHVAKSGWQPTEALGATYGANAVAHATAVGLPLGTSIWLDLEEVSEDSSANDVVAYSNAWFEKVEGAGFVSGVYVGINSRLTGEELYLRLKTMRYWKSGSDVPDIPYRGYCLVQHIIRNDSVAGVEICRDVAMVDNFGNSPMLAVRSTDNLNRGMARTMPVENLETDGRNQEETTLRALAAAHDLTPAMEAMIDFRNTSGQPNSARFWGIVNFNLRSGIPRLFIFDVVSDSVQSYLCAHGKGSDGGHDDGVTRIFSNIRDSNCSSLGVYRCAEPYNGKHGHSMRLDGLEPTNSNARDRDIVMHGAIYVTPQIAATGRIGRSDGCLAVENRYVTELVHQLSGGSLIIAWH